MAATNKTFNCPCKFTSLIKITIKSLYVYIVTAVLNCVYTGNCDRRRTKHSNINVL